jgi:hypothetical protein
MKETGRFSGTNPFSNPSSGKYTTVNNQKSTNPFDDDTIPLVSKETRNSIFFISFSYRTLVQ